MPTPARSDPRQALQVFLLGGFRVAVGSRLIDHARWRRRKASALVKILTLTPGHSLHRDKIIDLLWPEAAPEAAANNFHQAVYLARHILDPAQADPLRWLGLENDFLSLAPEEPIQIDVETFEAAALEARRGRTTTLYRRALDLYAGDLLPEDRFADWAAPRRESLHQEQIALLIGLAETYTEAKEYEAAITALNQAIATEPHHEQAHRALMGLYARNGNREQALTQFEHLRSMLRNELEVEPDAASQKLYQDILTGQWRPLEPAAPGLPDTFPPQRALDRHAHNLPVQLTRFVGREDEIVEVQRLLTTTRLLTLTGPGGCGKTRLALRVVEDLLDSCEYPDDVWFVDLAPLSDPAFVPRAVANVLAVQEAAGQAITEKLAAALEPRHLLVLLDNCEHLTDACARLCEALLRACPKLNILATSREPLRVSGEIVWLVPSLSLPDLNRLPALPELIDYAAIRLFVERAQAIAAHFNLTPENASAVVRLCFHLDGIPLALELAAARANVLSVEQILARLADRFNLLTRGSRTALDRQQTLRAAIDWSYDLLSEAERILFRRLTVFAGGWSLEAAETVAGSAAGGDVDALLPSSEVLDLLSRLVDKSLVLVEQHDGEAHFRMLETIREYGRQRLDESGEAHWVAARHCAWCIAFLEQVNPNFWGPDHAHWIKRLDREYENVRAALAWCAAHEAASGLRLATLLEQYWALRGYAREGVGHLQSLLKRVPESTTRLANGLLTLVLLEARLGDNHGEENNRLETILTIDSRLEYGTDAVQAHLIFGAMTYVRNSRERAGLFFESGLALAQAAGDRAGIACAQHFLGVQACGVGDSERAQTQLEQSLEHFRDLGAEPDISPVFLNLNEMPYAYGVRRRWWIVDEDTFLLIRHVSASSAVGYGLGNQGSLARAMGDHPRAVARYADSQAQFGAIGDQSGMSLILGQLGYLFLTARDQGRAVAAMEHSLALRRELGDRRGSGRSLNNLAHAHIVGGNYGRARACLEESRELFQEMGDRPGLAQTFNHLGNWALEQDDFALAESFYENSLQLFSSFGNRGAGPILLNLAECARGTGNHTLVRVRLERARACFEVEGNPTGLAAAQAQLDHLTGAAPPEK